MRKALAMITCGIILFCSACSSTDPKAMTARQTLDSFFQCIDQKDANGLDSLLAANRQDISWELDKWKTFKVNSIEDITTEDRVNGFNSSGAGMGKHLYAVKVFKASFHVTFTGGSATGMSDGYYDWLFFVVQQEKDSPWRIADWGY
jgi:hypothetical protein